MCRYSECWKKEETGHISSSEIMQNNDNDEEIGGRDSLCVRAHTCTWETYKENLVLNTIFKHKTSHDSS
jgi:hypothetical protein